jgi:hypothetical protein
MRLRLTYVINGEAERLHGSFRLPGERIRAVEYSRLVGIHVAWEQLVVELAQLPGLLHEILQFSVFSGLLGANDLVINRFLGWNLFFQLVKCLFDGVLIRLHQLGSLLLVLVVAFIVVKF